LLVGAEVMIGFDPARLEQMLASAAAAGSSSDGAASLPAR
jgi:hypothetical protein